jgi:hypothetical protein
MVQDEPSNKLILSGTELVDLMRQVLSRGKSFRFHARGGSMAPFIQDGDTICIIPLGRGGPGLGEVAAFLQPQTGRLLVHRVVSKHGQTYQIQGDNINGNPDLVLLENLLGRVAHVERKGRQVRLGLGLERYLLALVSRIGLLVALYRRAGFILNRPGRDGR